MTEYNAELVSVVLCLILQLVNKVLGSEIIASHPGGSWTSTSTWKFTFVGVGGDTKS
jgi:hypothetical protein